jgi:NAD(P)-dependent dehydrogenase (short-subunit alcohol dehydrogenase family)
MKVAMVTGAGRGIGASTSLLLARQGYDLFLNYRADQSSVDAICDQIRELGQQVVSFQADISEESQVEKMFEALDQTYPQLDVLVNNAGVLFTQMSLADMSAERINTTLKTNVTGTLLCCREAVPRMSHGGSIVNVSSAASRLGSPNEYVDYAASKGAIDTLTIGLAKEVASQGIRVNAVRPGVIYTSLHADGGEPDRVDRVKSSVPLQRGGDPKEVAEAIAWLASDLSSYTTGSFIDVSGGR